MLETCPGKNLWKISLCPSTRARKLVTEIYGKKLLLKFRLNIAWITHIASCLRPLFCRFAPSKMFAVFTLISLASMFILPAESSCISDQHINGCSVPFKGNFPYEKRFKPACDRHDVCYRCVSYIRIPCFVFKKLCNLSMNIIKILYLFYIQLCSYLFYDCMLAMCSFFNMKKYANSFEASFPRVLDNRLDTDLNIFNDLTIYEGAH